MKLIYLTGDKPRYTRNRPCRMRTDSVLQIKSGRNSAFSVKIRIKYATTKNLTKHSCF